MTKNEAIQELSLLSSGTIGSLTGLSKYSDIDDFLLKKYNQL